MSLTVSQWHDRFSQQAAWTRQLRSFLYDQVGLCANSRVLEVGCGTGALVPDFAGDEQISYFGLDIDFERLAFIQKKQISTSFLDADAYSLPFADDSFDFVISHYLFLWLSHPLEVLLEMKRVTRSSGIILALAEPDYSSRIDEPPSLKTLGAAQTRALQSQGVNPQAGRTLPGLFSQAKLSQVRYGISGFQIEAGKIPDGFDQEWRVLTEDLQENLSPVELVDFQELDRQAWLNGSRVLWVPTFYALGTKGPKSYANHH